MILNAQQIREAHISGDILIEPFEEKQVQAATYDLRVGEQGATTTTKKLVDLRKTGYILVAPGDFAIVSVLEEIRLGSQYAGRFGLRSKYARKGLIATTGPQIDPGFHGRLIVGVTNLTPTAVSLPHGDDFVSIEFHKLSEPTTKPYSGPFQGKMELGPDEIEMVTEGQGMALSEILTTMSSLSSNVASLASEVKGLKVSVPLIVGVGVTLIAILVAIK